MNINIPVGNSRKLEGFIRKPKGVGPFPTVLFVHGLGMTMHEWKNSFDELSEQLTAVGFATVQFTFDIFGDREVRELPVTERAKQLDDVAKWLLHASFVDTKRIGLLAQSYGVATALSADLWAYRSMVFVGGTYHVDVAIANVYRELGVAIDYKGDTTLPQSSEEHTTVDASFWQDARNVDSKQRAGLITTQKVLVIHGDGDTKIPPGDAKEFYRSLGTPHKRLKIFVGGDHGIIDVPCSMREEFLKEVVEWFKQTL